MDWLHMLPHVLLPGGILREWVASVEEGSCSYEVGNLVTAGEVVDRLQNLGGEDNGLLEPEEVGMNSPWFPLFSSSSVVL